MSNTPTPVLSYVVKDEGEDETSTPEPVESPNKKAGKYQGRRANGRGPRRDGKRPGVKSELAKAPNPTKSDPHEASEMFSSLKCFSRGDQVLSGVFVNSYGGYSDLLDLIYNGIKFKSRGKREVLPRCLFNYYMYIVFYRRLLTIVRANGVLSHDLESSYQQLVALGDLWVPVQVAAYLEGMGNFVDPNGVRWKLALPQYPYRWTSTPIKGLYGNLGVSTDSEAYVCYSQMPMPFIFARYIQVCLQEVNPGAGGLSGVWQSGVEPELGMDRSVEPPVLRNYARVIHTEDSIGYKRWEPLSAAYSRKMRAIGWSEESAPYDMQPSQVNLSHATIRMAAEGMSCIRSLKGKLLTEKEFGNVEGSRVQMFYLGLKGAIGTMDSTYKRDGYLRLKCNIVCESQLHPKLWSAGYIFAFHAGLSKDTVPTSLRHESSSTHHEWNNFAGSGFSAQMLGEDPINRLGNGLVDYYRHWEHHHKYGDTDILTNSENFASAYNTRSEVLRSCMEHAFNVIP